MWSYENKDCAVRKAGHCRTDVKFKSKHNILKVQVSNLLWASTILTKGVTGPEHFLSNPFQFIIN
jgi:hypothetical protein